ncbi:MAG: UDP-3-O-acyl-N-acetylglucosamine deacetylase [Bacteroidales bacterium]|jgi:UDP-3-O-[3-hydroxymyristoyl] N-acetylglucosamine deacetylase/3-hydroxyacyl-[acyl-carrier-protein] dehydratase
MKQHTLKGIYIFKGKGIHTGLKVEMKLMPAPVNHGIIFKRTDIDGDAIVEANHNNISSIARSTSLKRNNVEVITIEHLLSAFSGLGVDNALIELNSPELPILDGSAKPYTDAIMVDGLLEQNEERNYLIIKEPLKIRDEVSGSEIMFFPSDKLEIELEIDYKSKVLGLQKAYFDKDMDYAKEIAPCRTFCFFHELEFLVKNNLIKGGDMYNAIVIVDNQISQDELDRMKNLFNVKNLERAPEGYLNNLKLHYSNECARHKLLDIIGDLYLVGKPIKAKVVAKKSGHSINTKAVKLLVNYEKYLYEK